MTARYAALILLTCYYGSYVADLGQGGSCEQCLDGWVSFRGSCYFFMEKDRMDWSGAKHFCTQYHDGAGLVVIETEQENDFLKDMLMQFSANGGHWARASDGGTEDIWKWKPQNIPVNFTSWFPGEPNSSGHEEDCLELMRRSDNNWNDESCLSLRHPLCEKRLDADGLPVG